jgi:hypothetical protein
MKTLMKCGCAAQGTCDDLRYVCAYVPALRAEAEVIGLRAENAELKKTIQGECRDPNGTIWECYARLQKEHAALKSRLEAAENVMATTKTKLTEFRECVDGGDVHAETGAGCDDGCCMEMGDLACDIMLAIQSYDVAREKKL